MMIFGHKKIKIGFVIIDSKTAYDKVMASTRIRIHDVINAFKGSKDYFLELYKQGRKYDLVIFQKIFGSKEYQLAQNLKKEETRVILDINVNYYDPSSKKIRNFQYENIRRFTNFCDAIIASSNYLKAYIQNLYPRKKIVFIPESIADKFFKVQKKHEFKNFITLLWCGYSIKSGEVLLIKDILKKLRQSLNFELLFIANTNPKLKIRGIKSRYLQYNHKKIEYQLLQGDIFISPRNLKDSYNLGNTFTRIGYPMAVGLPIIASPVDSYLGSPAILCKTTREWETNLIELINNNDLRNKLADEGKEYCRENFSLDLIKKEYENFFQNLIKKSIK